MRRPICAELTGFTEGPRIASIGFHFAASLGRGHFATTS